MQRDFELVRKLLIYFDAKPDLKVRQRPEIEGYDDDLIQHHCRMLYEAGFLTGETSRSRGDRVIEVLPFNLTWQGHEFLDSIREDTSWGKVKTYVGDKGQTLTFESIKVAVGVLVKAALGG